jgi:uncharacterized membrane protein
MRHFWGLLAAAFTSDAHAFALSFKTRKHASSRLLAIDPDGAVSSGIARPAPELLVSSLPQTQQQLALAAIALTLVGGTAAVMTSLSFLEELNQSFYNWWEFSWPIGFGLIYCAAGISHFTNKQDYCSIVPPPGTWGFFSLPYSKEIGLDYATFHVSWTGFVEILGGCSLLVSGLGIGPIPIEVSSMLLLLLTIAVSPANVYMFTHDVQMGSLPPVPYPSGHIFRGALQCIIFGFLLKMSIP